MDLREQYKIKMQFMTPLRPDLNAKAKYVEEVCLVRQQKFGTRW